MSAVGTLIIGSGVAATALTQTLLEADPNASILILEAGGRVKTKDFALWQDYLLTRNLPYRTCEDLSYPAPEKRGENALAGGSLPVNLDGARLIAYGGSTLHWGGWSFRLKPEDFELRSHTGKGADWPYGYDVLEPYYGAAEHHLAVSGDSTDRTVWRSRDYPFPHFPLTREDKLLADAMDTLGICYGAMPIARRGLSKTPSRHAPCQTTGTCKYCPFGARYVASNYLDDLRAWNDYPNFDVRLNAVVETIDLADRRRAASVTYVDRLSRQSVTIEAERVVVAAGAIESAKLLQRSISAHWPKGIGNDDGHVGAYLVTHPFLTFRGKRKSNELKLQPEMDFPTLVSRHFDSRQEQAKGKFIIINPATTANIDLVGKMRQGASRQDINDYVSGPLAMEINVMVEVFGEKANGVSNLEGRRNRFDMVETSVRYANPCWNTREAEIRAEIEKIWRAMDAEPTPDLSVSWRADHASGTTRMSRDPKDGVVDADLKIHGMDNLYVVSNGCFPALGAVNPTLTLTALALKLGDHLIQAGGVR
ncbi:GMC oxidoreductase [Azospirillum argentinense]|uniref:GMC oxidoreductase n=1 Tax=Azospirillum argentinense TaxID=2970906 RepID=A0ABW8VDP3_9PROT